ncbi:nucleoside hydrolase [Leptolyngbya sp. FACHB-261]|uniref:nucleoside hydrolase n=1 Tax=Leptolyngbya sp. FACHB-261 TaxID=2692806 RepID=UPI0016896256|nr:nucleoside hydrolase [Leptolyngbya sp. FACHB-261]MBD2104306.1 nucleoside hydrolase [Leptolyngbya sp. FACHB-261]
MKTGLTRMATVASLSTAIASFGIAIQPVLAASLTSRTPLIVDDDGSQDGLAALAYMLANPKFDVEAITMSHGVARPESQSFQSGLRRMLGFLDATDIPVGIGSATPLEGNNAFPAFIRNDADKFYAPFVTLPDDVPAIDFQPAAELIVQTIKNSPEPVAILATGSMTNIAQALRIDSSIINNIAVLQIMGGAVFVPGNLGVLPEPPFSTNRVAEFNIWLDPVASKEVFEAGERGLNIQLTPLDATNQVAFTRDDYRAWLATGTPESELAAELLDFSLVVVGGDVNPNPLWDMVAAINLSEPDFAPEVPLHIKIDAESAPGASQGQTVPFAGLPPNVLASLNPSFDNLGFSASEVFSAQQAQAVPEPTSILGLLVAGAVGGVIKKRRTT